MSYRCRCVWLGRHFILFLVLYCLCISVCLSTLFVKEILSVLVAVRKEDLTVALHRLTDDQICRCDDPQTLIFSVFFLFVPTGNQEVQNPPPPHFCSAFFTVGPKPIAVNTFCLTKTNLSGSHCQFYQTTLFPSIPESYICVAVGVSVLFPVAPLSCSDKPMMKAGEDKDCPRCTDNHTSISMKLLFQIFSQHIFCNSTEFLVKQLPWQHTLHPLDSVNKNSLVCTRRRKCQWWKWTCCHLFTHS